MKIMMPVEVVNDRCHYCKDFDADVVTRTISGMELYDENPKKSANMITVINEIRCTHFAECNWRAENILGVTSPETTDVPEKKKAAPRKKATVKKEAEQK